MSRKAKKSHIKRPKIITLCQSTRPLERLPSLLWLLSKPNPYVKIHYEDFQSTVMMSKLASCTKFCNIEHVME